jgi:hypothetical protein
MGGGGCSLFNSEAGSAVAAVARGVINLIPYDYY